MPGVEVDRREQSVGFSGWEMAVCMQGDGGALTGSSVGSLSPWGKVISLFPVSCQSESLVKQDLEKPNCKKRYQSSQKEFDSQPEKGLPATGVVSRKGLGGSGRGWTWGDFFPNLFNPTGLCQ